MHGRFTHLRVYSSYSLLTSTLRINQLIDSAKRHDMGAVALTDNSNMFGSLEFAIQATRNKIQPIMGVTLNLSMGIATDVNKYSIVLIAQNESGYRNLIQLSGNAYKNSTASPIIYLENLEHHNQGLLLIVGCIDGIVSNNLLDINVALKLKNLFHDRLYIEIQRYPLLPDLEGEQVLLDIAHSLDLPIVATNSCYLSGPDMSEAHDAVLCITDGKYIAQQERRKSSNDFYLKSEREMRELFADLPEAIENACLIAQRCSFAPSERDPVMPKFNTEKGTEDEVLKEIAYEGLQKYSKLHLTEYKNRLDYELKVIADMGYSGYFLIVADFMSWSRNNKISVGPGRGSGAGSLVAWVTGITDVDPIRFGLLFERFLNPERVSLPDFDLDFCQEKRDQTIQYVQERYGSDCVAQIITFGKLQARAVLRDVGRILGMPYSVVDRICKMIPNNPAHPITLQDALKLDENLRKEYVQEAGIKKLIDISLQLEGLYRHASVHAAGIVISDKPIEETMPLYFDDRHDNSMAITQYSMKYVELAGFIKFDFLGLKTLTLIDKTLKAIEDSQGKKIDIATIDFNDQATFALLSRGDVSGVFQLEGVTSRRALQQLQPDSIEDIIALISLNRPGPLENIPTYIARKHKREPIDYMHPMLEDVLKETFGVIVYQEQVMNIARVLAGYSLGAADLLRRAMGKKIPAEMAQQRAIFISGAAKNGVDEELAKNIFDLVDKFAGYGFNKSHATAYAIISYRTAWLRANYGIEFLVACLNLEIGDTDKIAEFIYEAKSFNIKVYPPDINLSKEYFSIEKNNKDIRYGLSACRNIGSAAAKAIEDSRDTHYKDIFDFITRVKGINKKTIESLIIVGAFDAMHPNRKQLIDSLAMIMKLAINNCAQADLFSEPSDNKIPLIATEDWGAAEKQRREFSIFGFYLTGHPLEKMHFMHNVLGFEYLSNVTSVATVLVVIDKIKIRSTKRGRYAILSISDSTASRSVSMYGDQISVNADNLQEGNVAVVNIVVRSDEDQNVRLIVNSIYSFDDFLVNKFRNLELLLTINEGFECSKLLDILQENPKGGTFRINIRLRNQNGDLLFKLPNSYRIGFDELNKIVALIDDLQLTINNSLNLRNLVN